jgi:hypothetical protein
VHWLVVADPDQADHTGTLLHTVLLQLDAGDSPRVQAQVVSLEAASAIPAAPAAAASPAAPAATKEYRAAVEHELNVMRARAFEYYRNRTVAVEFQPGSQRRP